MKGYFFREVLLQRTKLAHGKFELIIKINE